MFLLVFLALLLLLVVGGSCAAPELGPGPDGRLRPCPSSPNCVASEGDPGDAAHVAPFRIPEGIAPASAFAALVGVVEQRARVEERAEGYLRAVFVTRLLRFRDDFEARLDPEASLIHVRSASRIGYSDLGANRKRVEALREAFGAALAARGR